MSSRNKNTQYILIGVAAVASVGFLYYMSQQAPTKTKKKLDGDDDYLDLADDITVKAKGRSFEASEAVKSVETAGDKAAAAIATGKMDEKALHAKIEELDKKGKAFFKNKQVSVICANDGYVRKIDEGAFLFAT